MVTTGSAILSARVAHDGGVHVTFRSTVADDDSPHPEVLFLLEHGGGDDVFGSQIVGLDDVDTTEYHFDDEEEQRQHTTLVRALEQLGELAADAHPTLRRPPHRPDFGRVAIPADAALAYLREPWVQEARTVCEAWRHI